MQASHRICFKNWPHSAGLTSGDTIKWEFWILWFFLSLIFAGRVVLSSVGAFAGIIVLCIVAAIALVAYSLMHACTLPTAP